MTPGLTTNSVEFLLNGRSVAIDNAGAHTTLLDILRDRGFTGAKEGCAEGECGACMVLDVASHNGGCAYRAINSCLMLAPMAAGREIYTVEALAENGALSAAQQAMAAGGGSQCGYCTPGFVVSLFAEQYRPGRTGPCDPHALVGNLCRCTGYRPIADAARSLGSPPIGPFRDRLSRPAPQLERVVYEAGGARFERPTSLDECLSIATQDPKVRWIAGATDLGVESNLRFRRWPRLVSLEAVPELLEFSETPDAIRIGAALPLAEIELQWRSAPDVFEQWLPLFASPSLRNRATLGGNLATASPIGDGAPMLVALDASVVLASARGQRNVPLTAFFTGYRRSALEPGELIVAIEIPKPLPAYARFYKVAKRRMDDISTLAAGFSADLDPKGRVIRARFAFGGAAATPLRVYAAEEAILGERWNITSVKHVQAALERALSPFSDHRGSAEYRREAREIANRKILVGMRRGRMKIVGRHEAHESARGHVAGSALYTDDLCLRFPGLLHAWPVCAPHAHALVKTLDASAAIERPGVVAVLSGSDAPGQADSGSNRHDEPLFPSEVMFHQQPVAWVLGESLEAARLGAEFVRVSYEPLEPILTIEQAIAARSFLSGPLKMSRGDVSVVDNSSLQFSGELFIGGQEHFYLETQCAIAWLDECGGIGVESSTQHPTETQEVVARVLGIARNQVTVECLRMGGAFGGKEVQANAWAAIAALGAWKTKRPVRVRLTRALDMALTGKRHPFLARYSAGFRDDGRLDGTKISLYSDGGWSLDLSEPVLYRAMFHADNAYFLRAVELTGYICRTHKTSQTAFRGFGGPQGMVVIEEILDHAARRLGLPPELVRERNFYREGDATHYGQIVRHADRIGTIWNRPKESSNFTSRRAEIDASNAHSVHKKRGLAMTPAKFGISFTATFFNQAEALVLIYRDGSVQVNHGGTEMGQGLFTKIRQIAAESLGLPLASIRLMPTRTDKLPNTSATAASAGTDLNGAAVVDACSQIRQRLASVAATMLGCEAEAVCFENGRVFRPGAEAEAMTFGRLCEHAYRQRIPLIAHGFYRTPGIHFNAGAASGKPFHYFVYGAAVSEVEVDALTGDFRLLRTDILEDVGDSVSPLIDRGQIEGGFIQGVGWLTIEELLWDAQGRLATAGASTYKLPSFSEMPEVFNVSFLERAADPDVIFGSKAVGEPPLMLAISVREAIRDAIAAVRKGEPVDLQSPATPERIFFAIRRSREQSGASRTTARGASALCETEPAALAEGALPQ